MDRSNFKEHLFRSAQREANKHKFNFSHDSRDRIYDLISMGVERMTPTELGSGGQRRIAEEHIRQFVTLMANNANNRNIKGYLDAKSFAFVHLKLCPLWPFC